MKRDIIFPQVEGICIAIVKQAEGSWQVYFINKNEYALENVIINSRGYGELEGEQRQTSVLRHVFDRIEPSTYVPVEPIDPQVFGLNNEYWVSYYVGMTIYDKRFVFVPDSIVDANLIRIPYMEEAFGILHE